MLLNNEGKIFAGQRYDSTAEAWQMPQGGIDDGETPQQALFRELLEEVGTDKAEIIAECKDWLFYDLPQNLRNKLWNGRYAGQMQLWYLLKFTGSDSDINIDTDEPEFKNWRWVNCEELPSLIVEFKRDLYNSILQEFSEHLG